MKRIGVDVGGTFTDIVLVGETGDGNGSSVMTHKLPTTVADPSEGMTAGLLELCREHGVEPAAVDLLSHGTTIALNTIIEGTGAKVGLVTTKGFRDILAIGRHKRPINYSLQFELGHQKRPLVRRRYRVGVTERIVPPDGEVLVPLDEDEVRDAARYFAREGIEAVVIGFLWSFMNAAHEQRAAEIVAEIVPDAYVCTSHEIVSQYREFERLNTTALNAYVGPRMSRYVGNLTRRLRESGFRADVHLMQSNGGMSTAKASVRKPVALAMSGPVAGLIAAIWTGRQEGYPNVISLDMGGTSADIGVSVGGELRFKQLTESRVGPYQLMLPMVDIDAIGAGGGSIAHLDSTGILRVGPRSAGAHPGPAGYGQGGNEPTGTDANLTLGRLDPDYFLGGRMRLHPDLARSAIDEKLGSLGLSTEELALGIVELQNKTMVSAVEVNSVKRGYDPRDFALIAFGGAGPLHGVELARELSIDTVIVPPMPGITSALGLVATDVRYEHSVSNLQDMSSPELTRLGEDFDRLQEDAVAQLEADGFAGDSMELVRVAECRYAGQAHELRVPVAPGAFTDERAAEIVEGFHGLHQRTFGVSFEDKPVQLVNIRVVSVGKIPPLALPELEEGDSDPSPARRAEHELPYQAAGEVSRLPTSRYERARLRAGNVVEGPALIDQADSTTFIPPDTAATVSRSGSLIVRL